jgi:hypothetical protein
MVRLNHGPFGLNGKGRPFFQPGTLWVQLHLEPAYLLVQFSIVIRFCSLLLSAVMTEYLRAAFQKLPLPGADLIGVDPSLTGQLADCLVALGRFQGQPKLILRIVLPAFLRHQIVPPRASSCHRLSTLARGPAFGVNYTSSL